MLSLLPRGFATALLIGLLPLPLLAQDPDTTAQQLPEIAPREIEIRGELQVSFPSLERQPLRGFASPPAVPGLPQDHTPFLEPYKQELEQLPESLPTPELATTSFSRPAPPETGYMEVGGGRYASRFAEGHLTFPLTARQTLSLNADYFGTAGFSPFSGTASGVETLTDQADAELRFESRHDGVTLRAFAHGAGSRYTLYGEPMLALSPSAEAPERSHVSGGLGATIRTYGTVDSRVEVTYDRTAYDTEFPSTTETFREGRLGVDGRLSAPLGASELDLDVRAARSTYGGDVTDDSGYEVGAGLSALLAETDRLSVRAGGRVLRFEAPATPRAPAPGTAEATFIVPQVRAEFSLAPGATLFAENAPALTRRGLSELYLQNPYAVHAPSVRPTLYTTRAESGLRVGLGPVQLRGQVGFRYAPSYRYFLSPGSGAPSPSGLQDPGLAVEYGSARILHGGAELALQGVRPVEAALRLSVRDGTLVGPDVALPYFSPVVAEGLFSVSFADQRGLLQTTGAVESPRPVGRGGSREVDTYVSFDVEGSYEVTSLLDVVLEVRNLSPSPPERWARYPRPPAILSGGFRIHW